jgi:ABC-type Fe3+/spermidine/putrescine transport system ATPase subunit
MGPSGAGKSTLLKVLSGTHLPAKGERLGAERVSLMNPLLETPANVTLQTWLMDAITLSRDEEKKVQLARDMADFFELPMQLKRKVSELSQGQLQRARLAHALIDFPDLLLLDEPFAHLDPILRSELMVLMKRYLKERSLTVVWVTHDKDEALALADRVGVLNHGKWDQLATAAELFHTPRTLLVAQLMGHVNFLTATRAPQGFTTVLGPWAPSDEKFLRKTHLVLAPRPASFVLDSSGPHKAEVIERRYLGFGFRLTLRLGSEQWFLDHSLNAPQVGEIVSFSVDLYHSVVVDCL